MIGVPSSGGEVVPMTSAVPPDLGTVHLSTPPHGTCPGSQRTAEGQLILGTLQSAPCPEYFCKLAPWVTQKPVPLSEVVVS